MLGADDYEVKVVERKSRADGARYVLLLRDPIPLGTRAILRLRLSLDDRQGESFREIVVLDRRALPRRAPGLPRHHLPGDARGHALHPRAGDRLRHEPEDGGRRVLVDPGRAQPGAWRATWCA